MSSIVLQAPTESVAQDATGAELVRSYLGTLQSRKSRVTTAESLRRIARIIGASDELAVPWHRLTFDGMHLVRSKLAEIYSPATANMTLSAMRQITKIAFILGYVDARAHAAASAIRPIRGSRISQGRALTFPEQEKLLAHFRSLPKYRNGMLASGVILSIGGGLRREELCHLACSADRGSELRVLGKGNRERAVVIDPDMREALDQWLAVRARLVPDHEAIFCSPQMPDRMLSCVAWWHECRRAADACGVPFSGPHDFRRTFATRLLDSGCDVFEVQDLMGHEDQSTTKRYDHRRRDKLVAKRAGMRILKESAE